MIGTIVNTAAILIGAGTGTILNRALPKGLEKTLIQSTGLVALSLGISWIAKHLPTTPEPLVFILSLAGGGVVGEMLRLESRIDTLKKRFTPKEEGSNPLEGLITAVFLFCVGTLSVVGPLESALNNNHTLLYTNALLDGITSLILASAYGPTILWAAPILFCWQGGIYASASLVAPFATPLLLSQISIVGGALIIATGLNVLGLAKIRSLSLLPALFGPVLWELGKRLF
ncbi:MAG: DUF554 domain-containing protein [Spirochaetales bacterium]|nr:DUF554 domain-containing protein [Spirochaetales bacterium]